MKRTLVVLKSIKLLTINGFMKFMGSVLSEGLNLTTLLRYISKLYPVRIALSDDPVQYTYLGLYEKAKGTALYLRSYEGIQRKARVGLMCRNSAGMVTSLFALSRLGTNTFLLNAELKAEQLKNIIDTYGLQFIIHDQAIQDNINGIRLIKINEIISGLPQVSKKIRLKREYYSKISILTGGTTGTPKTATRKSVLVNFIYPFHDLLTVINIQKYNSVYIPIPLFHGFGLTAFLVCIAMGKTVYLSSEFDTWKAGALIKNNGIEVLATVPLILQRLVDNQPDKLDSLKCVISGAALLNPKLLAKATSILGPVVFNLYGTSEAGFSLMATPEDLMLHPDTIGRPISGVDIKVLDENNIPVKNNSVGRICLNSRTTASNAGKWVETGDLGCQDKSGYFFLRGRADDMIISGGENVYPIELEHALLQIPEIAEAAVIGIADVEFGQRLKAYIVLKQNTFLKESDIRAWLKTHTPRYLMPKEIIYLTEIPYTALGKPDKKALKRNDQ